MWGKRGSKPEDESYNSNKSKEAAGKNPNSKKAGNVPDEKKMTRHTQKPHRGKVGIKKQQRISEHMDLNMEKRYFNKTQVKLMSVRKKRWEKEQ